ncbi:DUF4232 domain-containing protein [Streptacidiphilus sp. MAP5-3]|uniref:DUF4232 domain-containing protein n=1 Tax=unclassified Streptacidiphilus TaxID=2643834 RepID=UPI003518C044
MNGPADPRGHAGDPNEPNDATEPSDATERDEGNEANQANERDVPAGDPVGPETDTLGGEPTDTDGPESRGDLGDLSDLGDLGDLLLPIEPMPIPEGAFTQIRRRAVRRKRKRALAGATACVAVLGVSLYLVGVPAPQGPGEVVTPPASATQAVPTPAPVSTSPSPSASPSAVPTQAPSPTSSSTPTSPPTAQASVSATPAPGSTGSGSGSGGGTPLCTASQLSAALGSGNAGAGQIYSYLVVTNHSSAPCHVTGYPGLSMLDAHGAQIGAPATYEHIGYSPVVLAPGASASDTIHTVNRQTNNPSECLPTSTSMRIYPPGSRASLVFPGQVTNCDNLFSVTPFGPGVTGNPPG